MDSKVLFIKVLLKGELIATYRMKQCEWLQIIDTLDKKREIKINNTKYKLSDFVVLFTESVQAVDPPKIDMIKLFS